MSIRLFVTSSGLMIFSWLVVTYLTAVPMDTYPGRVETEVVSASEGAPTLAKASAKLEESASREP